MIEQFLATVQSANTRTAYKRDVQSFLSWLGEDRLGELKPGELLDFVAYLQEEGYAPASINRTLSAVKSFLRWAALKELVRPEVYSAAQVVRGVKAPSKLPRPFTTEEIERIFRVPDLTTENGARDYALMQFLYSTGARLAEVVALNIEHIDFASRTVIVWGKGSKERLAAFDQETADALVYYLSVRGNPTRGPLFTNERGERISPRGVRHRLTEIGDACGVYVHPHKFRRTFAVDALNATGDIDAVSKALGHAHISTTTIYTRLATDGLHSLNDAVAARRGRRRTADVMPLCTARAEVSAREEALWRQD